MRRCNFIKIRESVLNREKDHLFYDVIKKSILTEKTTRLETKQRTVTCIVPDWADRKFIKRAFESVFGVCVMHVNIMNIVGKTKNSKTKQNASFKKSDRKKAMIKVDSMAKIGETLK